MSFLNKFLGLFKGSKQPTVNQQEQIKTPFRFSPDELTEEEKQFCVDAQLSEDDGLFLKQLTKRRIEKLEFENEYSDVEKPSAICSLAKEAHAKQIISQHQEKFRNAGKFIFLSEVDIGGYKVALIGNTSDPYKVIEFAETNGINYDVETHDIIAKYKKWDSEFGIKPIGIGFDFCECEIVNRDIDYKKLAAEVYEFCPDAVDQGTGTIEELENEIRRTGTIYLWWD